MRRQLLEVQQAGLKEERDRLPRSGHIVRPGATSASESTALGFGARLHFQRWYANDRAATVNRHHRAGNQPRTV